VCLGQVATGKWYYTHAQAQRFAYRRRHPASDGGALQYLATERPGRKLHQEGHMEESHMSRGPGLYRSDQPWSQIMSGPGLVSLALILALLYGGYFWFIRRVVVGPNEVLVLLKKDGSRSLEGDQIIIPRPPDRRDTVAYTTWERTYRDVNGIL